MKKLPPVLILLFCIVLFCACSASGQYFLFGTFCEIKIEIEDSGARKTEREIADMLKRLDDLFSPTLEGSDIWRINAATGGVAVEIAEETAQALAICQKIYENSGGAFDPTVYPLVKLWKFSPDTYTGLGQTPPQKTQIDALLNFVGFSQMLDIDFENNSVTKAYSQVQIDLGGVAKGYAAQLAAKILNGKKALVNLGGNILCSGRNYKIGVAHPRAAAPYFGSMTVGGGLSVSTSGDYERRYQYDDVFYHHIINPATGYPAGFDQNGALLSGRLISVTVVSSFHGECDAAATAALVLGKEMGEAFLRECGYSAILIDAGLNYFVVGDLDFAV
jgi:thiamine biosynthesis lipoprotein